MTEIETLRKAAHDFCGMTENEFDKSISYWEKKEYKKGDFYNQYKNICKYFGFVTDGVFRTYFVNGDSNEEKNVFFFTKHQFITAKSFITQTPCNYYTEAMTDASVLYIHYNNLIKLYQQSHSWEKFGRIIAEKSFDLAMTRAENFMFLTPEQRYLNLVEEHPDIFNAVPLFHIASYLDIKGPSLSRIRKRMSHQ